jgi:POT family proton-dependent oligopeptide transporter
MTNIDKAPDAPAHERTWFGHPRPLARLFSTEAWERFGYYGMRALLILYLTKHFYFEDRTAGGLYGAFTSLVYLTPLIGGFVADQYFGSKKSVKFGAILMAIGYLTLAFTGGPVSKPNVTIDGHKYGIEVVTTKDGDDQYIVDGGNKFKIVGNQDKSITLEGATGAVPAHVAAGHYKFDADRNTANVILLFLSLATIIVGNGYFKPNISTIVGTLYPQGDRRRDAGFTIFYMGINLGSIFSQFLAPWIAAVYGFQWGFALAGMGMLIAWLLFQFDNHALDGYGEPPPGDNTMRDIMIVIGSIVAIPVVWFLFDNAMAAAQAASGEGAGIMGFITTLPLLGKMMFFVFFAAVFGIPIWATISLDATARNRMIVAIVLMVFSTVFWTLFEQAGSSLTLFADRNTDLYIGNLPIIGPYTMPAGQVQVFNPVFIVLFAPVFSIMWSWLGKRGLEPSVPFKFAIGLFLVGFGFLVLVFGSRFHDAAFKVGLFWLALAYFIHSIGELCLSPVGLSAITKLSVPRLAGVMMGVWFLSSSVAQYVGGIIAQFAASDTVGGKVLNPEVSLNTYLGVFQGIGIAGLIAGGLMLLLWIPLKRGMKGIT